MSAAYCFCRWFLQHDVEVAQSFLLQMVQHPGAAVLRITGKNLGVCLPDGLRLLRRLIPAGRAVLRNAFSFIVTLAFLSGMVEYLGGNWQTVGKSGAAISGS